MIKELCYSPHYGGTQFDLISSLKTLAGNSLGLQELVWTPLSQPYAPAVWLGTLRAHPSVPTGDKPVVGAW